MDPRHIAKPNLGVHKDVDSVECAVFGIIQRIALAVYGDLRDTDF